MSRASSGAGAASNECWVKAMCLDWPETTGASVTPVAATSIKLEIHLRFEYIVKLLTVSSLQAKADLHQIRLERLHIGDQRILLNSFLNIRDIFGGVAVIEIPK